jgi:hypothetical protein
MASHWPFGHPQPKLWAKEGLGVKLTVWLPTTKSRESTLRVQHVVGKSSTRATTLVQTLLRSDFAVGSYELPKSRDSTQDNFGTISGLQLGSPGKKSHFDVASVERHREYYKGEGGGFPRVRAVVSQVNPNARGLSPTPKGVSKCELTMWVVCFDADSSLIY